MLYEVTCVPGHRLQQRITMLQAMVDSPEEAEGWDVAQEERPVSTAGTMTSSSLHRILQVLSNTDSVVDSHHGSSHRTMLCAVLHA